MRAIVLAAGEGTRLRPITLDRPKCLVPLDGRPLLLTQVGALAAAGVDDVTVLTGYRADQIRALGLTTIHNERYAETNMVASLMCARDRFDGSDDVLIAYGDLVYEPRLLRALVASDAPVAITVDAAWRELWSLRMDDPLADAETLKLDGDGNVVDLGKPPASYADIEGQYMGLIKVRADFAPAFVAAYDALDPAGPYDGRDRDSMYMTSFLQHLIDHLTLVAAVVVERGWLEIDTLDDLARYESMAAEGVLDRFFTPMEG
jgi:L-glutamine-phosphate cytidylyltransferase